MVKMHRDTNTTGHKRYTLSCSSRAVTEEYIRKYIVKIRYFKPVSGVTTSWPCARWFWKNDRKYSYLNSYYLYVTCNHFDSKRHSSDYFLTKPFILTNPPPLVTPLKPVIYLLKIVDSLRYIQWNIFNESGKWL